MTADRCTGRCCRGFYLNKPLAALRAEAEAGIGDAIEVLALVQRRARVFYPGGGMREVFDCPHLLASGDCGIYERRPEMCREFPNGRPCPHGAECGSALARAGYVGRAWSGDRGPRYLPVLGSGGEITLHARSRTVNLFKHEYPAGTVERVEERLQ